MILEQLKRLFVTLPEEPVDNVFSSSEADALFCAMGCENMPIYMPADVWQRVSDMEYDRPRV
ncbi:hypothetical protein [Martelella alba]|uniref:Uncharacterized protein n=1 Tax=Martelella alba TaxID=2590451 RepID=A0ABY2SJ84_9HYPH|nr:hypothetical protein [Martelella alba]TKI05338.1 hypothetical protein FCN80_14590 [Martelella alba]